MKESVQKVTILAAGLGSRLLPLTSVAPKPLITVNGRTLIERQIAVLAEVGVRRVNIVIGYLGEQVVNLLGSGEAHGCKIEYVHQENPRYSEHALLAAWNQGLSDRRAMFLCVDDLLNRDELQFLVCASDDEVVAIGRIVPQAVVPRLSVGSGGIASRISTSFADPLMTYNMSVPTRLLDGYATLLDAEAPEPFVSYLGRLLPAQKVRLRLSSSVEINTLRDLGYANGGSQ